MGAMVDEARVGQVRHVWAMGLCNGSYGFAYTVILVTMPQIMAADGIGEPAIAAATALAGMMSLATFVVAPVLDTLFSRRGWAVLLGLAAAVLSAVTLGVSPRSGLIVPLLMGDALTCVMLTSALGGWLGAALPKSVDDTVGASFAAGNGLGFGLGALCQFPLIHALPAPLGQIAVGALVLVPLALLPLIPVPESGRKVMRESFGTLGRDLAVLIRRPLVLRIAWMFALPCAAFTLTNAFGGLGPDFHASAQMVDMANGFGAIVAGLAGMLLARVLLRRLAGPLLYLGTGIVGAGFTVTMIALPHSAPVYLLAVAGENVAQSMAQVAQNAIVFGSIRRGSALAASQFGLLTTAAILPYTYMQALDGYGYHLVGGVAGSFWMDAGLSLVACLILIEPVLRWMRGGLLQAADDAPAKV
jgi:MFS transporter, PAT family, beta-lactamase induction signal transducer AmpG